MSFAPLALVTDPSGLEWADLGVLAAAFAAFVFACWAWPATVLRPFWWLIARLRYRLRVYGGDNLPATGPALLVSNHVSYVDWLLIWVACPRRVHFVVWAVFRRNPILRFFLWIARAVAIDPSAGPHALDRRLKKIAELLDRGEVVCVFPEGRLTRNAEMLPFHRGFERFLQHAQSNVPVIPTAVYHVWGSFLSYSGGKVVWKLPRRRLYPAAVAFGPPLPKDTPAPAVRQAVQRAMAQAAIRQSDYALPVHRRFVRVAARFLRMFRPCYIDTAGAEPRTLSYARTLAGVICLSRWLRGQLGPEQNVGVWLPSSVGGALANISLACLGKTSVNLNYTAGADAVASAARQAGVRCALTSKRFTHRVPLELPEDVRRIYLEDALGVITSGQRIRAFLMVLLLPGWVLDRWVLGLGKCRPDDIATIIFSSGSTGEPKGVMLSHRNIAANADSMIQAIDVNFRDRLLGVLPFFHSFGYTVTLWAPLQVGASSVYHPDPRAAKEVGELCRKYRCTILLSTATFLRFYLRRCDPEDFKSLRLLVCGAEKLPPSLAEEFRAKFGMLPLEGYGCTELSPVVAVNLPDREVNGVRQVGNKIGTIGQPVPGVAVKVVNPETEEELPIGQEGLLLSTGANVMVGYLGKPEQTAKVVRDGWYVTGDMAKLDDDGFITLTGRLSRFAKVGGEMVPLERLEEELHGILGTADRLLAVTAVPDEKRGERLVVLHLDGLPVPARDLVKRLGERGLPNLWVPGERDFYTIPEMPVLGSGKIDLRRLKEVAEQVVRDK